MGRNSEQRSDGHWLLVPLRHDDDIRHCGRLRRAVATSHTEGTLLDQNPALLSSRDQEGSLPLHVACHRGAVFTIIQSLANLFKASAKSVAPQGDLPLFLACEMPDTSLDTIFILMKLYPDLVYR
jgi:ankyrin repeat protein